LAATINRYAHAALRPRDDDRIQVHSADYGLRVNYGVDDPMLFDGKLDLVTAAIGKIGSRDRGGYDLFLQSGAPPGSGLGSSSTVMVALVELLKEFHHLPLSSYEVADLAHHIERNDLGIKGGLQDHYAATFGGFNYIEFSGDSVLVNPLRIPDHIIHELEHNMLLCYTGITRASHAIIEDQTSRMVGGKQDTLEGLRMQRELAVEMKDALLRNRLRRFGELLDTAWDYKKRMSPHITNDFIDTIYGEAIKHGAIGGKVTGAGGGGHMLFYCDFERRHLVAQRLIELGATVTEFAFDHSGVTTWTADAREC
jgi:D-glycero-alpha-D-manno-heptose-7-phosphate kinase